MAPSTDFPGKNWGKVDLATPRKEIVYDGNYYDVTDFIKRHPGGEQIMGYFAIPGEDATLAIQQFHARSFNKVEGIMKSLKSRPVTESPDDPLDKATREKNKALTEDFTKLYKELKAEGIFDPSYTHITYRIVELLVFTVVGLYIITQYPNTLGKCFGVIVLSMAQGRAIWIFHEGGHYSLTGNVSIDKRIQIYSSGIWIGFSGVYWRRSHSLHHAMANRLKRDADIETAPFFINNIKILNDPVKENNFLLRNQVKLSFFYGILADFNTRVVMSLASLLKYRVLEEFLAIGLHYVAAYYIGFWPWLFSNWIALVYFAINLILPHSHLPVTDQPTHWVEYGLVHTCDVEQRPWCDWWMGHLNYQIEHHLFPTMPQFKNKLIVGRVKALAEKHGLPYQVYSYKEAAVKSFKNLCDVGNQLRALSKSKTLKNE
ncbi:unnamed protein product [Orchesella dallaii]|uniref:Cytochrome b5 heme-binding domain-containing protein n=1 Tax=Orchesella dallaii TaxID=48710 RepID=A0ABP1RCK5_9HEXA